MIDLNTLIQVAPYPEDVKNQLFEKVDTLNDDQKRELENLSWDLIVEEFENKISLDSQIALNELALGEKTSNEVDLEKLEDDYFKDLTTRLSSEDTKGKIEEIRSRLLSQSKN